MSTSKRTGWRSGVRHVCLSVALAATAAASAVAQTATPTGLPMNAAPVSDTRNTENVFQVLAPESKVSIIQLQTQTLDFARKIEVVDGFDPNILNVTPVSPTQIRLRAETTGVTSMSVRDESGAIYKIEVFVEGDVRELRAYLQRLFPGSAIEVVPLRDSVVLRGWVTDPLAIPQIMSVAKQMYPVVHNQMQVAGATMVQLHVKILEVQRSKLKQLGFNFIASGQRYAVASTIGGLTSVSGIASNFGTAPVAAVGTSTAPFKFAITGNSSHFNGFIDALTTESLAKVLAEPTLVTTSGRPASLLSGGEFPIIVPGSVGTVSIQFKEFGVRMEAIPTVLGAGRLRLDIAPEVSERDFSSAVNIGGIPVPGTNTRRVNTQVEMSFGETIMIGGLIQKKRITTSSKYPIIGELPVIGAAFSRRTHEIGETELLIMVTPELAGAMRPDQVPHDVPGWLQDEPTSKELFLDGMLEVPSYGPECADCENGMSGGMTCSKQMPGMIPADQTNSSPQPAPEPSGSLQLAPTDEEMAPPPATADETIQTMSGRGDSQKVIQAGGDPFRVPVRREIPDSTGRKSKADRTEKATTDSSDSHSLPGPVGPQRTNVAKPNSRKRSAEVASPENLDLAP